MKGKVMIEAEALEKLKEFVPENLHAELLGNGMTPWDECRQVFLAEMKPPSYFKQRGLLTVLSGIMHHVFGVNDSRKVQDREKALAITSDLVALLHKHKGNKDD